MVVCSFKRDESCWSSVTRIGSGTKENAKVFFGFAFTQTKGSHMILVFA